MPAGVLPTPRHSGAPDRHRPPPVAHCWSPGACPQRKRPSAAARRLPHRRGRCGCGNPVQAFPWARAADTAPRQPPGPVSRSKSAEQAAGRSRRRCSHNRVGRFKMDEQPQVFRCGRVTGVAQLERHGERIARPHRPAGQFHAGQLGFEGSATRSRVGGCAPCRRGSKRQRSESRSGFSYAIWFLELCARSQSAHPPSAMLRPSPGEPPCRPCAPA